MVEIIDDPREVEQAYARQYENLAREFARLISTKLGKLAEVGLGKGQLTIPLAKLLSHARFDVVDTFTGAYTGTFGQLKWALSRAKLKNRIRVYKTDYLDWLWDQYSDSYRGIISSEFLAEIDSHELSIFIPQCYRVLRRGGITVHSFLSPRPSNSRQRLLIEADTNPRWTKTPPKEWFSPRPRLVVSTLRRNGFQNIRVKRIRSNLTIRGSAAKKLLGDWDVRNSFWEKHKARLVEDGLEVPDWMIVSGRKA